MATVIRVRDVVRGDVHEFGPNEVVLRGGYNLFRPTGPVELHDGAIEWREGDGVRESRVVAARLGDTQAGERVLLRFEPGEGDEWWLCEVEAVDGVVGTH